MLTAFLLLTFLIFSSETYASDLDDVFIDRYDLDVVEEDVLTVFIRPVLEEVSVDCKPLDRGNPFDLSISTNNTDPYYGQTTAIWMRPGSRGTYNLTITFQSYKPWDYTIGVYTRNTEFYAEYYGKGIRTSGYFMELRGPYTRPSGNWTINIRLDSHRKTPAVLVIELPSPLNAVLFVTIAGFIAYFNVFLISDTYFKNKKEIVSNKRWLLCGIVMIVSALAIYQLYTFSTFTLSWSI